MQEPFLRSHDLVHRLSLKECVAELAAFDSPHVIYLTRFSSEISLLTEHIDTSLCQFLYMVLSLCRATGMLWQQTLKKNPQSVMVVPCAYASQQKLYMPASGGEVGAFKPARVTALHGKVFDLSNTFFHLGLCRSSIQLTKLTVC